jgi:hypothetical protein
MPTTPLSPTRNRTELWRAAAAARIDGGAIGDAVLSLVGSGPSR